MFAILISEQNMDKILERVTPTPERHPDFNFYLKRERKYYVITGYVTEMGRVIDWVVLPDFLLKHYEHDKNKIETDWDQIV